MGKPIGYYVGQYIKLRDRQKALDDEHKETVAPIKEAMGKLEDLFQRRMDKDDLEQLQSEDGTAYKSEQANVTASDKLTFLDYVRQNDAWHLLDIRPAKTAIKDFVEEQDTPPPGVTYKTFTKINVRRS